MAKDGAVSTAETTGDSSLFMGEITLSSGRN
jgi:hypothetical protein